MKAVIASVLTGSVILLASIVISSGMLALRDEKIAGLRIQVSELQPFVLECMKEE